MIFIGFDSSNYGQKIAYDTCVKSIRKYNQDIDITPLVKKTLINNKVFDRKDSDGSTEFTYTRFLVPYLKNYKGWALFFDSDFLWFCDPEEIFKKYCDNRYAVYCVKHEYKKCNGREKMDGQKQEWYPKKNWSSLMLFNCSHPSVKNLTLKNVNTKSPKWLHRMEWCKESEIGEIDKCYNYLVDYYHDNKYKALHYTDGGPWHPGYENCMYSSEWLQNINKNQFQKMNKCINDLYSKNVLCCIPARYGSSRLPGKPLLKINNKTIINLVYEQVQKSIVKNIIVLTDDKRIYEEVIKFGGNCYIVEENCLNGTERIVRYLRKTEHSNYDKILNVQGDEPFIDSNIIDKLIKQNYKNKNECSTICYKTKDKEEILSKSKGKVILDENNNILYCSRNVIPSCKNSNIVDDINYNIHVGIFLFNKQYLIENFLKKNTKYQLTEDIEWLKIIESGYKINTIISDKMETGIDTIDDYNYLKKKYEKN